MGAAQWTTCPAIILLDLLTNTRYGLGNHIIDSNLDLFSFVTASKFSNNLLMMVLVDKKLDSLAI